MDDEDYDDGMYPVFEEIDFARIHALFRSLSLFDDMYLNMQAMNIALIDQFITEWEYSLLQEYVKIEKTPLDTAMFVSAQSQMWIFALYELLRTWRSRINKLLKWKSSGGITQVLNNLEQDRFNLATHFRKSHLEMLRDAPAFACALQSDSELLNGVFAMTAAIRINLAKHEIQGKENSFPRAPGYGRINNWYGALDFELQHKDGSFEYLNRRDIAEALRKIEIPNRES
ncbi:hypothetical protein JZU46_07380 [bacterium]|jgi:hypothetical protein|nr:hypothetical protein [bacterium]